MASIQLSPVYPGLQRHMYLELVMFEHVELCWHGDREQGLKYSHEEP